MFTCAQLRAMIQLRNGEGETMRRITDATDRSYFRSERFFAVDGRWFFATREGGDRGPFRQQADARAALLAYLRDEIGLPTTPTDAWSKPGASN